MRLRLSEEVATALAEGRPVVALESALIAHGLPEPYHVETALAMEANVRANGAVPATIAIVAGEPRVGLDSAAMERLAHGDAKKVSTRDLAGVVARRGDGATTVAATMTIAARAGIAVFGTGGIGGVHRRGTETFDISADLYELARTRVAVVSSGAKALLDLALTLEWLETHGVPVVGYGTREFPAFYAASSGLPLGETVGNAAEAAALFASQVALDLRAGVLFAVPAPSDAALPAHVVEAAIVSALAAADRDGISGPAITPYMLNRVAAATEGAALSANVALLQNNAGVAAQIAVALARRKTEDG